VARISQPKGFLAQTAALAALPPELAAGPQGSGSKAQLLNSRQASCGGFFGLFCVLNVFQAPCSVLLLCVGIRSSDHFTAAENYLWILRE
jgi:hypothetical protein